MSPNEMCWILQASSYVLVILTSFLGGTVCANAELDLIADLMSHYDTDVRPSENVSEPVEVYMDMTLHQIIEVNARDQVLTCSIWQRLFWRDDHLRWDPTNYAGLKKIRLRAERIWRPDISLVNDVRSESHDDDALAYPARVTLEGNVSWLTPRHLESSCTLDMTHFPWDRQICILQFSSWTHDRSELMLLNVSQEADHTDYIINGEWRLVGLPIRRYLQSAPCCEEPFVTLEFEIHIGRRAWYYVGNLIFPAALITTAGMLVFCLPPEGGEKVSLSVTILLATTVYQILLADRLPIQSITTPLIGRYIMCTQILLGLSTTLTVFVISLYYHGNWGYRVPKCIRSVVVVLATILCLGKTARTILKPAQHTQEGKNSHTSSDTNENGQENSILMNNITDNSTSKESNSIGESPIDTSSSHGNITTSILPSLRNIVKSLDKFETDFRAREADDSVKLEWMFVSKVVDRLFIVLFGVSVFVCSLALLTRHDNI